MQSNETIKSSVAYLEMRHGHGNQCYKEKFNLLCCLAELVNWLTRKERVVQQEKFF